MHVADDLMAILFIVLAVINVNPEVKAIADLDDGLIDVHMGGLELKPRL